MQYFKSKTKLSILAFILIVLTITISISTFAKTEAYFLKFPELTNIDLREWEEEGIVFKIF